MPTTENLRFLPLALLLLFFAGCGDRFTYQYSTGSQARNSSQATRGWIPKWLPNEATDVRLQYDLDTNEQWLRFNLSSDKKNHFLCAFSPVSDSHVKQSFARHPRGVDWWFEGLVQFEPSNDSALNAQFYIDEHQTSEKSYIAVDRVSEKIYAYIERR